MSNTLLLHIGTPKTGTSAIQHALHCNEEKLREYGWIYPDLKAELNDIRDYASNPEKNGNIFYKGTKLYEKDNTEWRRISDKLDSFLDRGNVILSAEEIYEYDTDSFIWRMTEHSPNIKILVYLRRQDLYVESRWNQIVKDDRCYQGTFNQYVEESDRWDEGHYLEKLEKMSDIIGKENITIRVYEQGQLLNGNAVEDFFQTIGIKGYADKGRGKHGNDSLEGELIEVKRAINQIYDVQKYGTSRAWSDVLKRVYMKTPDSARGGRSYFSPNERSKYLSQYEDENREIAYSFLHRDDGKLFYDEIVNLPKSNYEISDVMQMAIQELMKEAFEQIIKG